MRIIAGELRGRLLKTRAGRDVRPTSDKLRGTLFNILRAEVPGSVFIDCYAGSGAVGLEAVSRGAAQVYLIEQEPSAARILEENISAFRASPGVSTKARLVRSDVRAALRKLEAQGVRANICFLDPPYAALAEAIRNLSWLATSSLLEPQGLIILEHSRKDVSPDRIGTEARPWKRTRLLEQGSSALSFYLLRRE